MDKSLLMEKFKVLIKQSELVFLSTVDCDGFPETRAMLNLRNEKMFPNLQQYFKDGFVAYFSSNTASQKINDILDNSKASAYYVNPKSAEGLLLKGNIEIIKNNKLKKDFWQENWTAYYKYKGGAEDPFYSLLKFTPTEYKYYNGNFKVSCEML